MSHHPWQGTSAKHLAGMTGEHRPQRSSTPLMPDAVFTTLFQHAWQLIERAHYLLELRDKVARDAVKRAGGGKTKQGITTRRILAEEGYPGKKRDLNRELMDLRLACYIVVASVTGCRNHEIVFSQSNSCYQSVGEDGEVYWWLRSQSTKTEEGHTEWMIPEAGVTALMVMERWSKPYQKEVENEIRVRRASNPSDPEIAEASRHRRAVFLGFGPAKRVVRTLSIFRWNVELKVFAKKCGLDWRPATHQFRRKFANYAARSQFGDLRYLREHFKHWSQDMTNLYALNDAVEMELFLEIEREFGELKRGVVEKWFQEDERLAGGFGENIVAYRGSEDIKLFASRAQMIKSVSEGISIRSNGHAWCTADDGGGCVGNDVERSRCSGCNSAVIDSRHTRIYQGLYDHLKEVAKCDDIGTTGHARVERDLARCGRVLENLGCGLEEGLHEPTS
jgi:integrase